MISDNLMKLQGLFRELFQLDMADLDFGLYRLFNIKRQEIEDFLMRQLPDEVDEAFRILSERDKADFREGLQKLEEQIKEDLPPDTILSNGDVKPAYRDAPLVKRYLDQKERIERIEASEEQKADVFNHLFNFFSRYYDEGDFIPKRFYGSRESYAVPYNGEEVFFHWANKDQHYVKTGENFRDYNFKVEGLGTAYHIRFALAEATTPKDNTKGEYRYFFPQPQKTSFDKKTKTLILPFEYRLPTAEEVQKYGAKTKGQDAILIEAVPKVMDAVPDDMLRDLLGEVVHKTDKEEVTLLLKRLRHFTRKNTTDYFIHKNLEGFLNQELEFYIKDQMLHLADLETDFDQKRLMLRVFRGLANTIITFLSQIEELQRRVFEKKKFVLETNYCITLDRVPEELYPEIPANDAQREEWVKLFAIDEIKKDLAGAVDYSEPLTVEFLKGNPFLMLDTKFFSQEFRDRLLASFEDLDAITDGLFIYGENFQALTLMKEKYHEKVRCIHIDPPYNTQTSGFLYKNYYQHSSWMAMMEERIKTGILLLSPEGSYLCHIDENEYERLQLIFERFSVPNAGTIAWDKRNPMNAGRGVATQHEYVIWRSRQETPIYLQNTNIMSMLRKAAEIVKKHGGASKEAQREYVAWVNGNSELSGGERAYRYLDEQGRVYQSVSLRAPEPRTDPKFFKPLIHPVTGKPCAIPPNGFSRTPETLHSMLERGEIIFGPDEKTQPRQQVLLTEKSRRQISSVIKDGRKGKADVSPLGLEFPYCHPVSLYEELIGAASPSYGDTILDYFAGSGPTAHAVINLNREDGGNRKYILIEMADYFDTVLIPRIKKVIYSKNWKNGKPVSREGISHMFKYIRLESYEDALHNLASDGTLSRIKSKEEVYKAAKGENEYRIRYLVNLPLEASDTMLNLARLEHPFNYTLEVLTDDGPRPQSVDLVETFNFLYGLSVRRLVTWKNEKDGRDYRVVKAADREGRKRILVVWRDMADLDPKIERKFLEGMLKEEDEFDEKLINGDTATPGFQSLDSLFKRLMEAD